MAIVNKPVDPDRELEFKIINWIAIIDQLATALATSKLNAIDLPMPEFIMLNHFMHRPLEGKTVSDVARQRQMPQPGVSKTIRKMLNKGWLQAKESETDGRSFTVFVTESGAATYHQALTLLFPTLEAAFCGMEPAVKRALFAALTDLKERFELTRKG